ncbi:hypothetical protein M2321_001295 [Rhodoblastus acidophilus]|jgi:hypothetical protein|nr:hypothetical protein [Rhodoblastus acidophilus]
MPELSRCISTPDPAPVGAANWLRPGVAVHVVSMVVDRSSISRRNCGRAFSSRARNAPAEAIDSDAAPGDSARSVLYIQLREDAGALPQR